MNQPRSDFNREPTPRGGQAGLPLGKLVLFGLIALAAYYFISKNQTSGPRPADPQAESQRGPDRGTARGPDRGPIRGTTPNDAPGGNASKSGWSMDDVDVPGNNKTPAATGTPSNTAGPKPKSGWSMDDVPNKNPNRVGTAEKSGTTKKGWSMDDVPKK